MSDATIDDPTLRGAFGRANAAELMAVLPERDRAELANVAQDVIDTHPVDTDMVGMACFDLACAGYDCSEMATLLPQVVDFAQRHLIPVDNAAENIAMALNSLGVEVEQADELLLLIDNAVIQELLTPSDVFETIRYVGPVATSAGVGIEYLLGRIMALSRQGITGKRAGVSLREDIIEAHDV